MNKIALFLVSVMCLVIFTVSCETSNQCELSEQEKTEIDSQIEGILKDFFNPSTLDYESHISLRANDEYYLYAGDGAFVFTGYDSYKEGVKAAFDGMQGWAALELTKTHVYVLAKDAASATVEFEGAFVTLDADTITHNGCWTFVFKKFGNEWKVVQENGTHLSD
jgi:hypothetical protein